MPVPAFVQNVKNDFSRRARAKRARMFNELFPDSRNLSILDLGGGIGKHIASIVPGHPNLTVADVELDQLDYARKQYGFKIRPIPQEGPLPFADGEFDLVFCSSVIEHVTGPKREAQQTRSTREFAARADIHQKRFADEIRRIGRGYFVQTPDKHFLVESHSNVPGFVMSLPRPAQLAIMKANPFGGYGPDFQLLTSAGMRRLFPDSEIHVERWMGLAKSIIAVKRVDAPAVIVREGRSNAGVGR